MSDSASPACELFFTSTPMQPLLFNENAVAGPSTLRYPRQDSLALGCTPSISCGSALPEVVGKKKSKGKARATGRKTRSSFSKTSSTISIKNRVAESARQRRVRAEVARGRLDSSLYDYLIRGLRFIMRRTHPSGWLARPTVQARQDTPTVVSINASSLPLVPSTSSTSNSIGEPRGDSLSVYEPNNEADFEAETGIVTSGNIPAVAQGENTAQPPDAHDVHPSDGDSSSGDTEPPEEDENVHGPDPFALPAPGPYWTPGRIAQGHACRMFKLAEAENLATKRAEKERFNEAQNAWIMETFGEVDGRRLLLDFEWMDFAERAHERMVNGIIDMNDEEERSRLLSSGAEAALQEIMNRDEEILREVETKQSQAAEMLGLHRLDSRQGRDRYIKSRRIRPVRFHPYSSCVRPARKVISRHFNQSGTWSGPAFREKGADLSPKVDREELYSRYHDRWVGLTHPDNEAELTFETVPWPVSHVPHSPRDIISSDILEFVQGENDWDDRDHVVVGLRELRRWMPDRFEKWVLRRVSDKRERKKVLTGAEVVRKFLVMMVSDGYKEQNSEAHTPIEG